MQIASKGSTFGGWTGGRNYHICSGLIGLTPEFYRAGIGSLQLSGEQHALDLGCGTGGLSFALAARAAPGARITGIDISDNQLDFARTRTNKFVCNLHFRNLSMDRLPFPDSTLDLVMTSMALHEMPVRARRAAIREAARVLKTNGHFLLIDWSKPRCTPLGLIWYAIVHRFGPRHDNWCNAYRGLAEAQGLLPEGDHYISGFARRQLFRKVIA